MNNDKNAVVAALLIVIAGVVLSDGMTNSYADVKRAYVMSRNCQHIEDSINCLNRAFRLAGNDTNSFAQALRELADEDTNLTSKVMVSLRTYKTPQSLPFLYAYATNALYGADALRAIFAIEGVTSNSISATEGYLSITNGIVVEGRGGASVCAELVGLVKSEGVDATCRTNALDIAKDFATTRNRNHYWLDYLLIKGDTSYRFSKRRLFVLRSADMSVVNWYQTNYVTNAINELVAYPEANLPD